MPLLSHLFSVSHVSEMNSQYLLQVFSCQIKNSCCNLCDRSHPLQEDHWQTPTDLSLQETTHYFVASKWHLQLLCHFLYFCNEPCVPCYCFSLSVTNRAHKKQFSLKSSPPVDDLVSHFAESIFGGLSLFSGMVYFLLHSVCTGVPAIKCEFSSQTMC